MLAHNAEYDAGLSNFKERNYESDWMTDAQYTQYEEGYKPTSTGRRKRFIDFPLPADDSMCKTISIPDLVDWTANMSPVQDQQEHKCGSCYIFAGVATLEAAVAIKYRIPTKKLSEQQLLQCLPEGCNGGDYSEIWAESRNNKGLVPSSLFAAYNGDPSGGCNETQPRQLYSFVDHWEFSNPGDEDVLKCMVYLHGPISVGIYISSEFRNYASGIFDDPTNQCKSNAPDHAVVIVGYGTTKNHRGVLIDYWLIRNSFGSSWGENGYFRMVRGKGLCDIAEAARFPILKNLCKSTYDITDSASGAYIKTVCLAPQPANKVTHSDAYTACSNNGMALYQYNLPYSTSLGKLYVILALSYGSSSPFWVDGVKESDDNWYYYSFGKEPAYVGLPWNTTASNATGCLSFFTKPPRLYVDGSDCTNTFNYLCEFVKY